MPLSEHLYKLKGIIRHYAWGGYNYIPELTGISNEKKEPCAEYWMGAHPASPSIVQTGQGDVPLNDLIERSPEKFLNKTVYAHFGELPFLFKVLDVRDMLSIQVHPSKKGAEEGFDREEKAGIPLTDPHRNYKDRNHKPELMVALSDFYLLHGFRTEASMEKILYDTLELNIFLPLFRKHGYKALYQMVMEMKQSDVDAIQGSLVAREKALKSMGQLTRNDPGWWVCKLYEGQDNISENFDRGIFSLYFFNIVKINKGDGIFQGAGVPHAYLEGQNIEIMANSDNVLRGGLTPKHVDVPELLRHTTFEGIIPHILSGQSIDQSSKETFYPSGVPDFGISKISMDVSGSLSLKAFSMEILLVTEGNCEIKEDGKPVLFLKRGEVAVLLPGTSYEICSDNRVTIYRAFVPQ